MTVKDKDEGFSPTEQTYVTAMSLRDFFAAQALAGVLSSLKWGEYPNIKIIAADAFEIADAMLAERAKATQSKGEGA